VLYRPFCLSRDHKLLQVRFGKRSVARAAYDEENGLDSVTETIHDLFELFQLLVAFFGFGKKASNLTVKS
jgi:hypothetical protein